MRGLLASFALRMRKDSQMCNSLYSGGNHKVKLAFRVANITVG